MIERSFEPLKLFINVKFILPEHKGSFDETNSISLYLNQTLADQFQSFLLKNGIRLKKGYIFYLLKGEDIIRRLPKNKTVKSLNLQTNDTILVTYEEKQIKSQPKPPIPIEVPLEENLDTNRNLDGQDAIAYVEKAKEKNDVQKEMKKKKIKIIIFSIISILLVLLALVFLFIYFFKKHKLSPEFNKEKLVVEKNYPTNMILRYSNKRETEMKLEGEKIQKKDSSQPLWMASDFIFIVRDEKVDKDEVKLTEKKLYSGYIAFLNLTSHNKTDDMMIVYDKTLNNILSNNNNY